MTEQYSQVVEAPMTPSYRRLQWLGMLCILFAIGAAILAVFFSWYLLILAAVFAVIGAVQIHFFNDAPKEYIYDFSDKRLVVAKKDTVNRTRRMLNIVFDDVIQLGILDGLKDDSDYIACANTYDMGVYALEFRMDGKAARLLFAPDEYLLALLKIKLGGRMK